MLAELLDKVLTADVMRQAMTEIEQMGAQWAQHRETRRGELVKKVRDIERRRDNLFSIMESHGAGSPDMVDVAQRLRMRSAELMELQTELDDLKHQVAPGKLRRVEPDLAIEVMREVVQAGDAAKKRMFLASFIKQLTVEGDRITVDDVDEVLVRIGCDSSVRTENRWLLDLGSNQGPTD